MGIGFWGLSLDDSTRYRVAGRSILEKRKRLDKGFEQGLIS
jgi:hypothetical protein